MVMIFYRYQDEKPKTVNAFEIRQQNVTLNDVITNFPEQKENLYFRIKTVINEKSQRMQKQYFSTVFLDIQNKSTKLPLYEGAIHIKILKLPETQEIKTNKQQDFLNFEQNNKSQQPQQQQSKTQNQTQVNQKDTFNPFSNQNIRKKSDLFESTVKLNEKELQEVQKKADLATQKLKDNWNNEQKQNEYKLDAAIELEPKVLAWAKKGTQRNDIRTLLCTLPDILWDENGFKACTLSSLLSENQVKVVYQFQKQYLMAIRIVHPDKLQGKDPKNKYIAERVFFELKESWDTFQMQNQKK